MLPPQGESLLILSRELGTKVYNKYIIQKRSQSRSVQRIQRLYEDYVQLLAKDTQVILGVAEEPQSGHWLRTLRVSVGRSHLVSLFELVFQTVISSVHN